MAGLTKLKTGGLDTGCVTADAIGTGAITVADIPDGEITHAKMADDSIDGDNIVDDVALPGNPTTTTQSSGNNTTRIATTAFVQTALGTVDVGQIETDQTFTSTKTLTGSKNYLMAGDIELQSGVELVLDDADTKLIIVG